MGMNKACDFQGAFVAFVERIEKDPKHPRFGGAKITSEVPAAKTTPAPTASPPPSQLPGKKAYIPPYTPKNVNRPNDPPRPSPRPISSRSSSSSASRSKPTPQRTPASSAATSSSSSSARTPSSSSHHSSSHRAAPSSAASPESSSHSSNHHKAKKAKISDKERLQVELASVPKRESSRRGAKDKVSQRIKSLHTGDDEEDIQDIDLEDSDDDASWTPFKGKGKEEAGAVADDDDYIDEDEVPEMPRHSDGRFMSNQEVKSAAAKNQSGFQKVESLPPPTQLVPDGKEFTIGDFMVLKSDANRDSAPIWRLDSGTLLQRYNPVPDSQGSATLHRSASLFSGYSAANRDNYLSVAVKFVSSTKDLVTVRIQKKADVNPVVDPTLRKRSLAETSQFQEPFEVYIQALISQCLDSNFLQEVFQDQDDYFVSNIEKVDSVTLLRKDKVMTGISWSVKFQRSLDTWPCLNDLGATAAQDGVRCGACDRDRAGTVISLYGQPYDPTTLKTVPPSEEAVMNRNFSVCTKCSRLGQLYHKLQHHKHKMFQMATEVVEERRRSSANPDTTKILNELLANEVWLEQQFRKMQDLWADTDTFIR